MTVTAVPRRVYPDPFIKFPLKSTVIMRMPQGYCSTCKDVIGQVASKCNKQGNRRLGIYVLYCHEPITVIIDGNNKVAVQEGEIYIRYKPAVSVDNLMTLKEWLEAHR